MEPAPGKPADAMSGRTVLGCELGRRLGRGSSGTVYRARQLRLDRDVAVKLVPVDAAVPGTEQRFEREVRAVASLNHPHVVPLHDAGPAEGLLVLVMGLVDGADLRQVVAERGPLPLPRALGITAQVGSALDAAHAAGVVHRDVKPGNVLLARDTGEWAGAAYLADFGLARDVATSGDHTVTGEGQWVGTPAYAAPEQLRGERVGPPADLFALAGLLFFMLTGRNPGHPPPEGLSPQVRAVVDVAERGMAADSRQRFSSAGALLGAAERARDDADGATVTMPVVAGGDREARPSRPPEQATGRRSRTGLVAAVALVAVLALAAAGWQVWGPGFTGADASAPRSGSASPSSTPSPSSPSPSESSSEPGDDWPSVTRASSEPLVRALQHLLVARGSDLAVDGVYGPSTRAEVARLQRSDGRDPTGEVDAATWESLTPRLFRGDIGEAVSGVQVLLSAAGYDVSNDGRFGQSTEQALRSFQRDRGLSADAVVGPNTWQELVDGA